MIVPNYTSEDLQKLPLRAIVALSAVPRGKSNTWPSCPMITRSTSGAGRLRARAVGQPVVLAPDDHVPRDRSRDRWRRFQFWTFGYSTGNPILFL